MGEIVYGNGPLEAYRIETERARDPRIVLGKSAYADLIDHIGYYTELKSSPRYDEWLLDADGQIFLNYLGIYFDAIEYDITHMREVLEEHKSEVETKLEECKDHPTLWSKYAWVAQYHNFFCRSHQKRLFARQKISTRLLGLKPRPIF